MIALIGKSLVIALCAGIASVAPLGLLMTFDGYDAGRVSGTFTSMLPFALIGSFAIGLPVALLTYFFSLRHLRASALTLFMIANLAGIMLILSSFLIADTAGMIFLGLPSLIAANVFALLGWFWIIKPREGQKDV